MRLKAHESFIASRHVWNEVPVIYPWLVFHANLWPSLNIAHPRGGLKAVSISGLSGAHAANSGIINARNIGFILFIRCNGKNVVIRLVYLTLLNGVIKRFLCRFPLRTIVANNLFCDFAFHYDDPASFLRFHAAIERKCGRASRFMLHFVYKCAGLTHRNANHPRYNTSQKRLCQACR